ncbi:hypothetical protein ACHAPT_010763 [Fusarium lateritium]
MAPITCKVIDSFHRGIPGVYATLYCKDQHESLVSVYESCTTDDGDIKFWFRAPFIENSEPEIVDIGTTPLISIAFSLSQHLAQSTTPWVKICCDLHLPAEHCHALILHLFQHSASYKFEHTRTPAVGPFQIETKEGRPPMWDLMQCDTPPRTPSPLRLPSPILDEISRHNAPLADESPNPKQRNRGRGRGRGRGRWSEG